MKKLIVAILALAVCAPAAATAASARHSLKVSPSLVDAGQSVHISGNVSGCPAKDRVIVTSKAFKDATKRTFNHLPALFIKQVHGRFSATITIESTVARGHYRVRGHCGTITLHSAQLRVSPSFY